MKSMEDSNQNIFRDKYVEMNKDAISPELNSLLLKLSEKLWFFGRIEELRFQLACFY